LRAWRREAKPEITRWNVLYLIAPSYLSNIAKVLPSRYDVDTLYIHFSQGIGMQ
jgi:hypothetical protein